MTAPQRTEIERTANVSAAPCYQCNRCTAGCPMLFAMDLTPAQIVHSLRLGQEQNVLESKAIWACVACQTCTARCPQDVDVDQLLTAARIVARRRGMEPAIKEISDFLESYMENMYLYGRIGEIPLLLTLKIKEQNFFDDFMLGIRLFTRGRLSLLDLPKGASQYRELYNRTKAKEESK